MCSVLTSLPLFSFSFFNHPAPTEIYTLSLHDALPISRRYIKARSCVRWAAARPTRTPKPRRLSARSEEHTSELQSLRHLVCRLLLEKKKKNNKKEHKILRHNTLKDTTSL